MEKTRRKYLLEAEQKFLRRSTQEADKEKQELKHIYLFYIL